MSPPSICSYKTRRMKTTNRSPMRPAEFGAFISSEITRWTADAKAAGIEAK